MKKLIFSIILSTFSFLIVAQSSAEAKTVLDKAFSAYENSKGIKISFNFSSVENNNTLQQQKGTAMVKGNKFKIAMSNVETWFDGNTQWVLMKDFNEVNISEPTMDEIATISPLALLSMYKTGYTLKSPVSKTINGKNTNVIELVPLSDKSEFRQITVAIDKISNSIVQVELTMKNGIKNKIEISEYNINYNYADSEFIFNKSQFPGAEIIDLR